MGDMDFDNIKIVRTTPLKTINFDDISELEGMLLFLLSQRANRQPERKPGEPRRASDAEQRYLAYSLPIY